MHSCIGNIVYIFRVIVLFALMFKFYYCSIGILLIILWVTGQLLYLHWDGARYWLLAGAVAEIPIQCYRMFEC